VSSELVTQQFFKLIKNLSTLEGKLGFAFFCKFFSWSTRCHIAWQASINAQAHCDSLKCSQVVLSSLFDCSLLQFFLVFLSFVWLLDLMTSRSFTCALQTHRQFHNLNQSLIFTFVFWLLVNLCARDWLSFILLSHTLTGLPSTTSYKSKSVKYHSNSPPVKLQVFFI